MKDTRHMWRWTRRYSMRNSSSSHASETSTIAVVGLGEIGLPLAVQFARHGHRVIGCDIDPEVVESINLGRSHIQEEPMLESEVPHLVYMRLLSATTDTTAAVQQANVVVVIVPVGVDANHEVDFTAIDAAT